MFQTASWYEKAELVYDFHLSKVKENGAAVRGKGGGWGLRQTGEHFGIDHSTAFNYIKVGKALRENPLLKQAGSLASALEILEHAVKHHKLPLVSFGGANVQVMATTKIFRERYFIISLPEPIQFGDKFIELVAVREKDL